MTDQELKDLVAQLAITQTRMLEEREQREKERQAQEKERKIEIERDFQKMRKEIGDFGRRWGTFTEGLVIPSLHRILKKEFGIDETSEHKKKSIGNDHLELDIFGCVNSTINNAVIVEIKSHLREDGIEQILEQLEKFPRFYPEHADKKLFGLIACVSAADNLRNVLRKKGIYLVIMGQEVARLQRPENFQPTNFNPQ
jgi:hypothetical protein